MGIDRIGNNRPPAPVSETTGSSRAAPAAQTFQVSKPASASAPKEVAIQASLSPLDRLRTGEVDASGYVDLKVHEATSHLVALPPGELEAIRGALREHLANDPALAELVQTAAGALSRPPDE
jgi:hypothetical protein